MNIAVLTFNSPDSARAQYRVLAPLRHESVKVDWAVRKQGEDHAVNHDALLKADVILVQKFFPQNFTEELLDACFNSGKPVIYETDDLLQAIPEENPRHDLARRTLRTLDKIAHRFAAISVPTRTLATAFKRRNGRVVVTPNRLDTTLWTPADPRTGGTPVRILYAGSPIHSADLEILRAPLARLLEKYGEAVELTLFGCSSPSFERLAGVRILPPTENYAAYVEAMNRLSFDIGLAPLEDTPFNRAGSHVKWMEYAVRGIAGVFSDLPPYACVRHGRTGLLANSPRTWLDGLKTLIENPGARTRMAYSAQEEVLSDHALADDTPSELLALCYELSGNNPDF